MSGRDDRSATRVLTRSPSAPPSRFSYLMALYGENHQRLGRLFDVESLPVGDYRSSVGDGLDLLLSIRVHHAYTIELCLTYAMTDPETGSQDPSAFVRWYRDARMVEATHCYVGRGWQDVLGLDADARTVIGHRLRMNVFLSKWLEYLGEQGHSRFTLAPCEALTWPSEDSFSPFGAANALR